MAIRTYDSPPPESDRPHLPIVRVPASGNIRLAITCFELLQVPTHFMGRRTLPCLDHHCPGCADQRPARYEAYVSGIRSGDKRHCIYALTPGAARLLLSGVPNPTQLRGHIIEIKRAGRRPNGTLRVDHDEHMVSADKLPPAPNLMEHMLHIWGLDSSHLANDHPEYAARVKKAYGAFPPSDDAHPGT